MPRSVVRLTIAFSAVAMISLPVCAVTLPRADRWTRVDLQEYRIYSEAGPVKTRDIANDLVRLSHALSATTTLRPHFDRPIRIFVFRSTHDFAPFRDAVFSGSARRNSGIFLGHSDGNYIAIDASADRRNYGLVYHELTHLNVNHSMPGAPVWLNEGLAEFYSTFAVLGDQATIGNPIRPHLRYLRRTVRPIPVDRLIELTNDSPEYRDGVRQTAVYAQSWLLVHYMMMGPPERRVAIHSYMASFPTLGHRRALEAALGMKIPQLEAELRAYARRLLFPQQLVRVPTLREDVEVTALAVPEDEVLAELGDFLTYGDRRGHPLSRALYEAALQRNPDNALANAGLGYITEMEGDAKTAARYFSNAVSCDPPGYFIYLLAGESALRSLFKHHENSAPPAAEVMRVRWLFAKALERAPRVGRAHFGYGKSFLFEPGADVEKGLEALERSWALNPQPDVALNLVIFHSRKGDRAMAEMYLTEAARLGAEPAIIGRAQQAAASADVHRINGLILEGREREALRLVDAMVAEASDPALRASLLRDATLIDDQVCRNEQAQVYNAALESARIGDYARALSLLDTLRSPTLSANVRDAAATLRERIVARMSSGSAN